MCDAFGIVQHPLALEPFEGGPDGHPLRGALWFRVDEELDPR